MPIETLDDILEDLANAAGVYGAHPQIGEYDMPIPAGVCKCRVCFLAGLHERVIRAVELEEILAKHRMRDLSARLRNKNKSYIQERTQTNVNTNPPDVPGREEQPAGSGGIGQELHNPGPGQADQ